MGEERPMRANESTTASTASSASGTLAMSQAVTLLLTETRSNEWTRPPGRLWAILASPHPATSQHPP